MKIALTSTWTINLGPVVYLKVRNGIVTHINDKRYGDYTPIILRYLLHYYAMQRQYGNTQVWKEKRNAIH